MFYLLNNKFEHDARKAVFCELSTQLEYFCENLRINTELSAFDEMTELIAELKTQATSHRVNKPLDEVQKLKEISVSTKFKTPDEVKF